MILLWLYLIGIIPAWFFIWPRLLHAVMGILYPDKVDYVMSGFASLWLAVIWPVTAVGVVAAKGFAHLGAYLFEKHTS